MERINNRAARAVSHLRTSLLSTNSGTDCFRAYLVVGDAAFDTNRRVGVVSIEAAAVECERPVRWHHSPSSFCAACRQRASDSRAATWGQKHDDVDGGGDRHAPKTS